MGCAHKVCRHLDVQEIIVTHPDISGFLANERAPRLSSANTDTQAWSGLGEAAALRHIS